MDQEYAEFRNTTSGVQGAIKIDRRGERKGIAVQPGQTVWLNEEEQEATANAPMRPEDNPFLPHPYEIRDPDTDQVKESGERPIFEMVTEHRPVPGRSRPIGTETAAAPRPTGDAPEGSYSPGEEVGTPPAQTVRPDGIESSEAVQGV